MQRRAFSSFLNICYADYNNDDDDDDTLLSPRLSKKRESTHTDTSYKLNNNEYLAANQEESNRPMLQLTRTR